MNMLTLVALALTATLSTCHVALMDPPARNVLWRAGYSFLPKHEDDDYLICYEERNKRCPPCGDPSNTPPPMPHQAGGEYALGIIGRNYTAGDRISVSASVTNSHGGYMEFKLCPHNNFNKAVSQRCLDKHPLEVVGHRNGRVAVTAPYQSTQEIRVTVQLPRDVTCSQCVIQMSQYTEQFKPSNVMFRNCADVSIQRKERASAKNSREYQSRERNDRRHQSQRYRGESRESNQGRRAIRFPNENDYFLGSGSSTSQLSVRKPSNVYSKKKSTQYQSSPKLKYYEGGLSDTARAQLSGANKQKLSKKKKKHDDYFLGFSSRKTDSAYRTRSKSMFPFYEPVNSAFFLSEI